MRSRYREPEAQQCVEHYAERCGEAVALRIYTSRLIGAEPSLVLHGGGNTSVKDRHQTLLGDDVQAIFIKGSGRDLAHLEPESLPALDLTYLRRLRELDALEDESLMNELRTHCFDASSPNPSVETLLHAFLPQRFVDHSHADAVLALTNQADGQAMIGEALGDEVLCLPYIRPGLPLAKAVAEAHEARPEARGIVLSKHGLLSFGASARESYECHVELVDRCEQFLARRMRTTSASVPAVASEREAAARVALAAPILRGLLAEAGEQRFGVRRRFVMDWRGAPEQLTFCASERAETLSAQSCLTPDHVIRTKSTPMFVDSPSWNDEAALREQLRRAVADYRSRYDRYFEEQCRIRRASKSRLDSAPRVVLLPGAGALCFGTNAREARITGDITEHTLRIKLLADSVGRYCGLEDSDLFDVEYWSLEQAKLGAHEPCALEGQVVVVTGGAGAIGVGIGEACAEAGAQVVLADLDLSRAEVAAAAAIESRFGSGSALGLALDVCDEVSVRACFDRVCVAYGGVDVVVPNAGVALVAAIEELSAAEVRRVADVNYLGVLLTIREAARVLRAQGSGGNIVINASKNVFAPGAQFGAYSASKAAAHQIGKVAALELAEIGVRVNAINADAVFAEGEVESGLWREVGPSRARSRGLAESDLPEFYRKRNLLEARVSGRHVGNAVVFFASELTPTTGATLPVDGGVAAAFPR